jgi:YidC/Oxa1 family membrane protein insertase
MWVQQKMTAPPVSDPQTQTQTQTMQVMMPIMFIFLSMTFPSGLALYWVVSNLFRITAQYFYSGWGGLAGVIEGVKKRLFPGKKNVPAKPKYIKK